MVGRTVQVLFEKAGREPGQIAGKSDYLHAVHVDGPDHLIGQIAAVEIVEARPNSLAGRLVG
jgi:tRNA-2-methylthio-N6-dimethylallyladenosine synthase